MDKQEYVQSYIQAMCHFVYHKHTSIPRDALLPSIRDFSVIDAIVR